MTATVCIGANTLQYPEGGGHQWVFLNWAMGLRANGADIFWLEEYDPAEPVAALQSRLDALKRCLEPYCLSDKIALYPKDGKTLRLDGLQGCLDLPTVAGQADFLLNVAYRMHPDIVRAFRRSVLLDIDPGLLQRWIARGEIRIARYDLYFSIGETVGRPGALFPTAGIDWIYTPPCVSLDCWQPHPPDANAAFTTVSHWYMHEWVEDDNGEVYENNKRSGFVPYFTLPRHTKQPLELALSLGPGDEREQEMLEGYGWRVRQSREVTSTPMAYHHYVQTALGEFSGVKPSCVHLQNAWISDRTICFLASGKPALVEHTGPSRFLPDGAGLFRFRGVKEAAQYLDIVAGDYAHQCSLARALAEEYFDAQVVTRQVLERVLD